MKYSDIIALQDYFHPVFNLQNEAVNYWKQFIPTSQFNTLLEKTLEEFEEKLGLTERFLKQEDKISKALEVLNGIDNVLGSKHINDVIKILSS